MKLTATVCFDGSTIPLYTEVMELKCVTSPKELCKKLVALFVEEVETHCPSLFMSIAQMWEFEFEGTVVSWWRFMLSCAMLILTHCGITYNYG